MAFKPITVNTPAAEPAHILAEDDAAIYEGIIGGDCVLPIGGLMKTTVLTNNKVRVSDGVVVVGGHVGRIVKGDYEDMTIANGTAGQKRNDIIAARFLAGADGGSDSFGLVVIRGTPGSSASDPVIVKGDLYAGDKQRDYPLWRVRLEGLSITKVEQMYEIGTTNKDLSDKAADLSGKIPEEGNGYLRFADGTLIQWGRAYFQSTASGGTGAVTVTFPIPFSVLPRMSATPIYAATATPVFNVSVQPRSDMKSANLYARTSAGAVVSSAYADWMAIGR